MSPRHVAPHVIADLVAGALSPGEAQRLEAHVAACAACRAAAERVRAAQATMAELAAAEPPALGWEGIGAKVHWSVSQARRAEAAPARRRLFWPALATAAAAAVVAVVAWSWPAPRPLAPLAALPELARDEQPGAAPAPLAPVAPASAVPLGGLVTLAQGDVLVDGEPLGWDRPLRAGQRVTTGEGRLHVQFGVASAFVLEPRSVLELRRFDSREIELRVEGAVGVTLERRAPEQRFVVLAAGRRVEVRGTVFRVAGGPDGLGVAVTRGRVAVVDGDVAVDVPAGSRVSVPLAARLGGISARPMGSSETRAFAAELRVHALSAWPSEGREDTADQLAASGARLRVAARPGQAVSVDGVSVGRGAVELRLPAGRHQIARAGEEPAWVELAAGQRIESTPPSRVISERARQVEAQLVTYKPRFEACANRARDITPDFTGELIFEVEIAADGAVASVVAIQGLSDHAAEDCLLGIVREQFTFPSGSRDIVRKVLRF